jgi:hypothetical protein
MSGKYAKKSANKKKARLLVWANSVCAVVLIALMMIVFWMDSRDDTDNPALETTLNQEAQQTEQRPAMPGDTTISGQVDVQDIHDLGSDVKITGYISYTGAFMEDRTDEVVTDVLAIQVTNSGEKYIQTMDITLTAGDVQAQFSLSTLFPGETVVVLEKNRMAYSTAPVFDQVETSAVALFDDHPGMCEDKLEIQCLDGVINVTNISNEDITADILIYYKNYVSGMYYGGITYRIRIEGGLKAGEIRQGTAAHFNPDNSTVVFVTCG